MLVARAIGSFRERVPGEEIGLRFFRATIGGFPTTFFG